MHGLNLERRVFDNILYDADRDNMNFIFKKCERIV
jgi:hypothetical protein